MLLLSRRFQAKFLQTTLAALAAVGLAVLSGCGDLNHSPLGSAQTAVPDGAPVQKADPARAAGGGLRLSFTPSHLFGAAAKIPVGVTDSLSTSGVISAADGGALSVRFAHSDTSFPGIRVVSGRFVVLPGSMAADTLITMTVYSGTSLDHVYVDFGPGGLVFAPSAVLALVLEGDFSNIDVGNLVVYHRFDDGTVEQVRVVTARFEDKLGILIEVPGFSSYSMGGDDDFAPEAEIY